MVFVLHANNLPEKFWMYVHNAFIHSGASDLLYASFVHLCSHLCTSVFEGLTPNNLLWYLFHTLCSHCNPLKFCEVISESPWGEFEAGWTRKEESSEGSRNGECRRKQLKKEGWEIKWDDSCFREFWCHVACGCWFPVLTKVTGLKSNQKPPTSIYWLWLSLGSRKNVEQ